jgi:hypothetical protein
MELFLHWLRSWLISQGALLLSLFFAVGALMRAYENLFGERKS